MTPLRITFVTTGLQTGGAESMLFNLLAHLDRARFAPTVVSLREPEHWRAPIERLGIPVLSVGMEPSQPTPRALARLRALVRDSAPDLLQGWMYHGNIAAVAARSAWPAPVCWSIHHSIYALRNEKPLTGALIAGGALLARVPARIFYVSHVSRAQHERPERRPPGERPCPGRDVRGQPDPQRIRGVRLHPDGQRDRCVQRDAVGDSRQRVHDPEPGQFTQPDPPGPDRHERRRGEQQQRPPGTAKPGSSRPTRRASRRPCGRARGRGGAHREASEDVWPAGAG